MSVFVRACLAVRDGRHAEFEQTITALSARAANESGTLTFRFFSREPGAIVVIEQYADAAAALAHNERSADLLARVGSSAEMVSVELYGTLGPELLEWASANRHVTTYPDFPEPGATP